MTYADDPVDAPCGRCGREVHLHDDPPQPCGEVRCQECSPCLCETCIRECGPTVVYDLPEADYHAHEGSLSASGAKWLSPPNPCPAKFKWHQENDERKAVFDFGHVVHRIVLGAGSEFEELPYDSRRSKAAQEHDEAIRARGNVPILSADLAHARAMAKAVQDDPTAGPLFTGGDAEVSLFWPDPETGVIRRARLDYLRPHPSGGRALIADLKTARSSDPYIFGKSAADFGYTISAANYVDGVKACGLHDDPAFLFAVVEKDAPHVVTVLQAEDDVIKLGRALMGAALKTYAECVRTDTWPGYTTGIEPLNLPGYFITRIEDLIA